MSESKSVAIEDQPSATALPTVSHFIGGQLVDGADDAGTHAAERKTQAYDSTTGPATSQKLIVVLP